MYPAATAVLQQPPRPLFTTAASPNFSLDMNTAEGITMWQRAAWLSSIPMWISLFGHQMQRKAKVLSWIFLSLSYTFIISSIFNDINALKRHNCHSPKAKLDVLTCILQNKPLRKTCSFQTKIITRFTFWPCLLYVRKLCASVIHFTFTLKPVKTFDTSLSLPALCRRWFRRCFNFSLVCIVAYVARIFVNLV